MGLKVCQRGTDREQVTYCECVTRTAGPILSRRALYAGLVLSSDMNALV